MNLVPVDPDAGLIPAMQAGAYGLRQGRVWSLFPEGERSIDGTVKSFKKGASILSHHLQVPIVPVALEGAFEILAAQPAAEWRRLFAGAGTRMKVVFGAPVHPTPRQRPRARTTPTWRSRGSCATQSRRCGWPRTHPVRPERVGGRTRSQLRPASAIAPSARSLASATTTRSRPSRFAR